MRKQPISPEGRKNNTSKVLIVLAVEIPQPKGFGRIRLRRIDKDSEEFVVPFVQACIETGSTLKTDGSASLLIRAVIACKWQAQGTVHF